MINTFDNWQGNGEELSHYGVLGMKWGQRRYQNSDGSLTERGKKHYAETGEYGYHYRSHTTKKYTKKAAKALQKGDTAKAAKYERRAKRSSEVDAREQEYAQRVRVGGNVAVRLLTKTIGGKNYQRHLAMNKDTTSTGSKVSAAILSGVGGRLLSSLRKANYIRQDEKAAKRAAKGKAADRGAAFRERAAAAKASFEQTVNSGSNAVMNTYRQNLERERRKNRG